MQSEAGIDDVVVAVVTFRRPGPLAVVLAAVVEQLDALPDVSAVVQVIDNDPEESARAVVASAGREDVRYRVEPEPGISAARNAALTAAGSARFLIFIDDDERPHGGWIRALLDTQRDHRAQAVVGPVRSVFASPLDPWVVAGGFWDREHRSGLRTGDRITVAATNNLLLDMDFLRRVGVRFDSRFGLSGGEDSKFTTELVAAGARIVWCAEAVVDDLVPESRTTRRYAIDRSRSLANAGARVRLAVAEPRHRTVLRFGLLTKGVVRWGVGAVQGAAGHLSGRLGHQARGARQRSRARGEVAAAVGVVDQPYAR